MVRLDNFFKKIDGILDVCYDFLNDTTLFLIYLQV